MGWEKYYSASHDLKSPFHDAAYNVLEYTQDIYGYYIHPLWDCIGSETLYVKILAIDYDKKFAVIELLGEWNDALHNDVMHLKRNVIEVLISYGINHHILLGENVFNFHASDDCYYEEWFEEIEDGWIAAINFKDFVIDEWKKYNLDCYMNYGGALDIENWRTLNPIKLFHTVNESIIKRLNL